MKNHFPKETSLDSVGALIEEEVGTKSPRGIITFSAGCVSETSL